MASGRNRDSSASPNQNCHVTTVYFKIRFPHLKLFHKLLKSAVSSLLCMNEFHYENILLHCNDVYSLPMKEIVSSLTFLNYHNVQVPINSMCNTSCVISSATSRKTHSCVYYTYNNLVLAASFGSSGALCNLCSVLQHIHFMNKVCE